MPFDMKSSVANRIGKYFRWRSDQQQCTERAADETRHAESKQYRGAVFELFPVTEQPAEEAGPECDRTGRIGDLWIEAEPDENWKREQRSSSGNGIDRARCEGGA